MPDAVTIVHLSDLQYGKFHRFPAGGDPANRFDSLAERLLDDLGSLRNGHGVQPDLLVVTGDLAEWGKRKELEQVQAFLRRIAGTLALPISRLVVIPGNHDINWDSCEAYFKECSADDIDPVAPYPAKWKFFRGFFASLYDGTDFTFTEERPYTLFPFPEIRTVVAGLNSTMAESHRSEDHYGFVGEPQYRWFADELRQYADQGWLRIAVVHHNVRRGNTSDDENLRDADMLNAYLGPLVHFVLHGHTHNGRADVLRQNVPIYATGSAAVKPEQRPPEVPNQYQVLRVTPRGIERMARAYVPDPARPHFVGDLRADDKGETWKVHDEIELDRVHGVFPEAGARQLKQSLAFFPPTPWYRLEDDLLSRVERVAQLRHGSAAEIQSFRLAGDPLPYVRISVRDGEFVTISPVGVASGMPAADLVRAFASSIHARYKTYDFGVPALIVHGSNDPVPAETRAEAKRLGVNLQSWLEYQGLLNFAPLVTAQTARLRQDPRYPSSLYIPQRYRTTISGVERFGDDALELMVEAMTRSESQFIVVLGEFGSGKSFLQRELAVRLAETGHPAPIFIEMRTLEKGRTLEELVAQHLVRNGFEVLNLRAFRYMLEQGRIALLFDGFDELVVRVTYERAAEHLETLLQAAGGSAKVVVTSRTQFFESDQQVRTALGERLDVVGGRRIVRLLRFDRPQIQAFLTRWTGSEEEALRRMELLEDVKDLMGLSENPRMLSFIAELDRADLEKAKGADGKVTSAALYRVLIERWLDFEIHRIEPKGAAPGLPLAARWDAVSVLARHLWEKPEPTIRLSEVSERIAETIASLPHLEPESATHQVASGTLLVRDAEGNFSFVHQSVLEWIVANNTANELRVDTIPRALTVKEMSRLMVDFFIDLGGKDAIEWARSVAAGESPDPVAKKNAVNVLGRLPEDQHVSEGMALRLADANLRAQDFSRQALRDADFTGADLREARFIEATLLHASLRGANLTDADLSRADLTGADLRDANFTRARLMGANLRDARLDGANFSRAKLIGAEVEVEQLRNANTFGAALRVDETLQPVIDLPANAAVLEWDHDGEYLYCGFSNEIRVLDVGRGQVLRTYVASGTTALAVSDDNTRLAVGAWPGRMSIIDTVTGDVIWADTLHDEMVTALRFSPNGRRLTVATRSAIHDFDCTINRWITPPAANFSRESHCVALSRDGDTAVIATGQEVRLWERSRGILPGAVAKTGTTSGLAMSMEPLQVVVSAEYKVVIATKTGKRELPNSRYTSAVAIAETGSHFAYSGGDGLVLVATASLKSDTVPIVANRIAFNRSGTHIAAAGLDGLYLVAVDQGTIERSLDVQPAMILVLAPRSSRRVSILTSSGFEEWHVDVRLASTPSAVSTPVLLGVVDPVTRRVAVMEDDASVSVFSREGVREFTYQLGRISEQIALQGDFLAVAELSSITIVDVQKGRLLSSPEALSGDVTALAFQPGSDVLWTAHDHYTHRGTLRSIHARNGRVGLFRSLSFEPRRLSVARDGFVAAAAQGVVEVHLARGDDRAERVYSETGIDDVFLSEDGRWLVTWSSTEIRIRKGFTDAPLFVVPTQIHIANVALSFGERVLYCASLSGVVMIIDLHSGKHVATLVRLMDGLIGIRPDGRYRIAGDIGGCFGHTIGLCRFEPGELEPYVSLALPEGEPLIARGER